MSDSIETLFRHFAKYIGLSDELKDALKQRLVFQSFRKNEIVHDSQFVCTKSYFILNGLLRTFYVKDDREVSEYFSFEEEWVNSPVSFIHRTIDIYSIDAIEPTDTFFLEIEELAFLFDHFPEMERYARLSMGNVFGHLIERITAQRFTSAKEKYDQFCKVYAGVYHRIPLGMVASYLGITQETLSRIRAAK